MQNLTIVMYHYVRDLIHTRYHSIKGLHLDDFKEQILYIKKHYHPISAYELMDAIQHGTKLPPESILLTFDDAYLDHFTTVFPILDNENISGCFFPPAKCILENTVLDVNKIHFILACVDDKNILVNYIYNAIEKYQTSYQLESKEFYWKQCGVSSRMDSAEIIFIKRMLQRELPEQLRYQITKDLFIKFVSNDEKAFSRELYMSIDQIQCLQNNHMYIGSHGFDHYWLNAMSESEQKKEIDLSLQFLEMIGSDTKRWIMCYPYGAYNDSLLSILMTRHCVAGLTTHMGIASLESPFTLSRLDTNDLPKEATAEPNYWKQQATLNQVYVAPS